MTAKSRAQLYIYACSLAYMQGTPLSRRTTHAIMTDSPEEINNHLLKLLSEKLNVSIASLKQAMNGASAPLASLVDIATELGVQSALKAHIKVWRKQTHEIRQRSNRKQHRTNLRNRRSHIDKQRRNLVRYIKALCVLQNTSLKSVAQETGYSQKDLVHGVLHDSPHDLFETLLGELPFIIQITQKDMHLIVAGSVSPQKRLVKDCSKRIIDRQTLIKCVSVLGCLRGYSLDSLGRKLKCDVSVAILQENREKLGTLLNRINRILGYQLDSHKLLIQANVPSADHAYVPRMYFRVDYRFAPVGYQQTDREYQFDRQKVANHLTIAHQLLRKYLSSRQAQSLSKFQQRQQFGTFKKQFTWQIWKILTAWNYMYGFDDRKFLTYNFKDYEDKYRHTSVIQGNANFTIRNASDWFVILKKLHEQLDAVKDAFDLKSVADSVYGEYSYMDKYGCLASPKVPHYRTALEALGHTHRQFTAEFATTGIEHTGSDETISYYPCLKLVNVKYHGKLVARSIWLRYGKQFRKLGQLQAGDLIQFSATPRKYWVGYFSKTTIKRANYGLSFPTSISILQQAHLRDFQPVPKDVDTLIGYCIENNKSASYDFTITGKTHYQYIRTCLHKYQVWCTAQKIAH